MLEETIDKISEVAKSKAEILNASPSRYFILAMLAGMYVGFGIMLIFSIGAPLNAEHAAGTKDSSRSLLSGYFPASAF